MRKAFDGAISSVKAAKDKNFKLCCCDHNHTRDCLFMVKLLQHESDNGK